MQADDGGQGEAHPPSPRLRATSPAPDRLVLTLGAFCALGVFAIGVNIIGPALDAIAEAFSLPLAQAGLLPSLVMVGLLVGVAGGGFLSDFAGTRTVAFLGLGALAAGVGLFASTELFPAALVAMALIGLGGGLIMGFANPLVATLWPRRVAPMLNLLNAIYPGCAILAALGTGAWIQGGLSWRVPYALVAGLAAATVLSFVGRRAPTTSGQAITPRQLPSLLGSPLFAHLALMMVLAMGAEAGVAGWLCFYAARELSFSAALAGSAISLFWAGMLVGRLLTSSLSGGVRLVLLIIICPAGACLAWLGVTASGAAAAIMPLLFVAGAFHSGTFPLILAYAKTKYEDVFGSAAGLLIAIGTVGGMLTPYLIGLAGERIGLRAAIGGIALLQLGIVLLACALLARDSDARHQGTAAM